VARALIMSKEHVSNEDDDKIIAIFDNVRTIALIGASDKPERDSHKVMAFLINKGYQVFPVNPLLAGKSIQGCEVYSSLADIPQPIDLVDVFRDSKYLYDIVVETKQAKVKRIWAQIGVMDAEAELLASNNDILMISNRCPAIELPRLMVKIN